MYKMINQFADKIKGQFSFFDRMILNGYFRPLLSKQTRIGHLYSMGIPLRDFTEYFKIITDRLLKQSEDNAGKLGRPVVYLPSVKDRKEDIAKAFLLSGPVDEGLIFVLKTLESCRTAKVVGGEGKHFLKSSHTKYLHYYLYYLDREFGFMFVKIQTWFPFNIQVYINGRELMKHVFDSTKLCRRLDAFAASLNPFLDTVQKNFGQGYFWCMDQCEFATDIMFKERSFLEDIYPSLVGHAFYDFSCTDVFTLLVRSARSSFFTILHHLPCFYCPIKLFTRINVKNITYAFSEVKIYQFFWNLNINLLEIVSNLSLLQIFKFIFQHSFRCQD